MRRASAVVLVATQRAEPTQLLMHSASHECLRVRAADESSSSSSSDEAEPSGKASEPVKLSDFLAAGDDE